MADDLPRLLSLLSFHDPNAEVTGLDGFNVGQFVPSEPWICSKPR